MDTLLRVEVGITAEKGNPTMERHLAATIKECLKQHYRDQSIAVEIKSPLRELPDIFYA